MEHLGSGEEVSWGNDSAWCPLSGAKSAVLGDLLASQIVLLELPPEGHISLPVGSVWQGSR